MIEAIHREPDDPRFLTDEPVRTIRRIEELRDTNDINLPGIRITLNLPQRVDRREDELRFLRDVG